MIPALVIFGAVVIAVLLIACRRKSDGWWVCDCGARFHSSAQLDTHINECEGK